MTIEEKVVDLNNRIKICFSAINGDLYLSKVASADNRPAASMLRLSFVFSNLQRVEALLKEIELLESIMIVSATTIKLAG